MRERERIGYARAPMIFPSLSLSRDDESISFPGLYYYDDGHRERGEMIRCCCCCSNNKLQPGIIITISRRPCAAPAALRLSLSLSSCVYCTPRSAPDSLCSPPPPPPGFLLRLGDGNIPLRITLKCRLSVKLLLQIIQPERICDTPSSS